MGVRAIITGLLLLVSWVNADHLDSRLKGSELGLADIPACGILCMLATVPATGCSLDDLNCVCSNEDLAHTLSACMLANCTMADTTGTARVQADLCDLSQESKRMQVFLYTGIVYSLAFLFVVLRIAGKMVSSRLSLDDIMVVAALLLTAVPLGCVLAMTKIGFGEHLWNLEDGTLLPILRLFYVSWSTYVVVLGLIKVSLILFYLEIFKTRNFAISAYIVLGYIIVNTLIIFLMTIFICKPVKSFWDRDIKGKCMDLQGLAYANSASAIVQDVILLILPLVFIRKLQMKRYRKIAVTFMFTIGTFGCIATIIRLQTLLAFKISIDPTWDYVPVTIWTELELAAGFACVSLPSIRILFVRLLPTKIKEILSQITHRSSKGSSGRKQATPPAQREWKKPSSWINISLHARDSENSTEPQKSFISGLWSRTSTSRFSSHMRSGSRRLDSTMSNYSEAGVAVTRPPYRERWDSDQSNQPVELQSMSKSPERALINKSRRSRSSEDDVTALPRIGCLPERNFSDLDLSGSLQKVKSRSSRDNNV
ncbi:hypothetical protein IQ07DRAFT_682501 [Pyrenochaeta sp. DS3sAY3a]|nr:hypothetical protein IQ07DRAFT_682501 [Pyrenochaeta sp. DS3sAY3a]